MLPEGGGTDLVGHLLQRASEAQRAAVHAVEQTPGRLPGGAARQREGPTGRWRGRRWRRRSMGQRRWRRQSCGQRRRRRRSRCRRGGRCPGLGPLRALGRQRSRGQRRWRRRSCGQRSAHAVEAVVEAVEGAAVVRSRRDLRDPPARRWRRRRPRAGRRRRARRAGTGSGVGSGGSGGRSAGKAVAGAGPGAATSPCSTACLAGARAVGARAASARFTLPRPRSARLQAGGAKAPLPTMTAGDDAAREGRWTLPRSLDAPKRLDAPGRFHLPLASHREGGLVPRRHLAARTRSWRRLLRALGPVREAVHRRCLRGPATPHRRGDFDTCGAFARRRRLRLRARRRRPRGGRRRRRRGEGRLPELPHEVAPSMFINIIVSMSL